jgi:hypothetical protein
MTDLDTMGETPSRAWAKSQAKGLDPLVRYMIFNWARGDQHSVRDARL